MRAALLLLAAASLLMAGCASVPRAAQVAKAPIYTQATPVQKQLSRLPPPSAPVAVAVYAFSDQTGQFKSSELGQTLSRAVTQGASSMLVKSLQDAGSRRWFTVVEREQLKNLLQERQIIRDMRERYLGEKTTNPSALPALLFAGVLLEGGVIGYDTNTLTGGAGAGFLGISASTQYRQDTVTVYLRAVSVKTGEVLTSVTTSKTIASFQVGANAFKYVGFKELLQAEAGFTTNEPDQLALQQAIDKAVYGLVLEGVDLGIWDFADRTSGAALLQHYRQERDGLYTAADVKAAQEAPRPKAQSRASNSRPVGAPAAMAWRTPG